MKRPTEYLVRKRDGRHEYLRSTKLAHSIHCALRAVGVSGGQEEWLPMELATTVVAGLRVRMAQQVEASCSTEAAEVLSTGELAAAVEHVLSATGYAEAALQYANTRAEQQRRQALLFGRHAHELSPGPNCFKGQTASDRAGQNLETWTNGWTVENRFSAN